MDNKLDEEEKKVYGLAVQNYKTVHHSNLNLCFALELEVKDCFSFWINVFV